MSGQGTVNLKAALIQGKPPLHRPRTAAMVTEEVDELVDLDTSSLQPIELAPEALYPVEELDPLQVEPTVEVPYFADPVTDVLDAPDAPRVMPENAFAPLQKPNIEDGLALLRRLLGEAGTAWRLEKGVACRTSLIQLQEQLPVLIEALPQKVEAPIPAQIREESVRIFEGQGSWSSAGHPYALVLDCPGDAARAPVLARVLEVDGVTARMLAVSRHPRVALRSADPEPLHRLSSRYQVKIGLNAAVVPREALLDIDLPRVVLGPAGLQSFRVTDTPLWLQEVHDPLIDGSVVRSPQLLLAVPGEVVTSHYRSNSDTARRGRRRDAYELSRETRTGVLDLHGPGIFLRVVEGATDFQGLPGYTISSRRRSFRGLVENIQQWFPNAQRFGSRVCRPTENPHPTPDQPLRPKLEVNAWPMWEEYTRLCRLLLGIR